MAAVLAVLINITTVYGLIQTPIGAAAIIAYVLGAVLATIILMIGLGLILKVARDFFVLVILNREISPESGRVKFWQVFIVGAAISFLFSVLKLAFYLGSALESGMTNSLLPMIIAPVFWGGVSAIVAAITNFRIKRT